MEKDAKEKAVKANHDNNELIKNFIEEKVKYETLKSKIPKKGSSREDFTLSLLSKFRSKLNALKQTQNEDEEDDNIEEVETVPEANLDDSQVEKEIEGDDWLRHTLRFKESVPILAKDASTKNDDWYDVYDPRNPLNKRKRKEADNQSSSKQNKKRI